jgi:hypothetical protein
VRRIDRLVANFKHRPASLQLSLHNYFSIRNRHGSTQF